MRQGCRSKRNVMSLLAGGGTIPVAGLNLPNMPHEIAI